MRIAAAQRFDGTLDNRCGRSENRCIRTQHDDVIAIRRSLLRHAMNLHADVRP